MEPIFSDHFQSRTPSSIRLAQIEFMKRTDGVQAVNTAIGNVSLPMHPAMVERMVSLGKEGSPFQKGVVKYSATVGMEEANQTFLHLIAASGFSTQGLYSQTTDGASHAMELAILGVCGPAGSEDRPLLVFDPTYSNYASMAKRTRRSLVAIERRLDEDGKFSMPSIEEIERVIQEKKPGALLAIPYDNPTGQFFSQKLLNELAALCVKYNLWVLSDEAYRELHYLPTGTSSIWGISETDVPGILGRRISIESASKVWNACGLRVGALITDNPEFHKRAVAENTANLCSNVLGQYVFGALLYESKAKLNTWFHQQREYYREMETLVASGLKREMPDLIVSKPDAAIYTVVDLRKMAGPEFDANDFVLYCAKKGAVSLNGVKTTLLMAPMDGFYSPPPGKPNPGKTAMRIAYVEPFYSMAEVPKLFAHLFRDYAV